MTTRKHASRMRNARLDVSIGWGGGVGTALVYLSSPWKGPWTRDTYPPRKDLGPEIPPQKGHGPGTPTPWKGPETRDTYPLPRVQTNTCENFTFPKIHWKFS